MPALTSFSSSNRPSLKFGELVTRVQLFPERSIREEDNGVRASSFVGAHYDDLQFPAEYLAPQKMSSNLLLRGELTRDSFTVAFTEPKNSDLKQSLLIPLLSDDDEAKKFVTVRHGFGEEPLSEMREHLQRSYTEMVEDAFELKNQTLELLEQEKSFTRFFQNHPRLVKLINLFNPEHMKIKTI